MKISRLCIFILVHAFSIGFNKILVTGCIDMLLKEFSQMFAGPGGTLMGISNANNLDRIRIFNNNQPVSIDQTEDEQRLERKFGDQDYMDTPSEDLDTNDDYIDATSVDETDDYDNEEMKYKTRRKPKCRSEKELRNRKFRRNEEEDDNSEELKKCIKNELARTQMCSEQTKNNKIKSNGHRDKIKRMHNKNENSFKRENLNISEEDENEFKKETKLKRKKVNDSKKKRKPLANAKERKNNEDSENVKLIRERQTGGRTSSYDDDTKQKLLNNLLQTKKSPRPEHVLYNLEPKTNRFDTKTYNRNIIVDQENDSRTFQTRDEPSNVPSTKKLKQPFIDMITNILDTMQLTSKHEYKRAKEKELRDDARWRLIKE